MIKVLMNIFSKSKIRKMYFISDNNWANAFYTSEKNKFDVSGNGF